MRAGLLYVEKGGLGTNVEGGIERDRHRVYPSISFAKHRCTVTEGYNKVWRIVS